MTAPPDRRVAGRDESPWPERQAAEPEAAALVDAEFARIVARNRGSDSDTADHGAADSDPGSFPPAERCAEPDGPAAELQQRAGRIASALFCASGLDAQVLTFAIRRLAEHCALDDGQVTDRIADDVMRIAVSLAPGR